MEYATMTQIACTLAAMWSIVCRMNLMTSETLPMVRAQHAGLFAALSFSLALPAPIGHAVLAAGVFAYLAAGMHRWRHGAPSETESKPMPLDPLGERA